MRLGYLVPGTGLDAEEKHRRESILNSFSAETDHVDVADVDAGPETIESVSDEERAAPHLVELGANLESDYDAFIIGCYSDLGIHQLRKAVSTPIIGPVRASFAVASSLSDSFGLLTLNEDVLTSFETKADEVGLKEELSDLAAVDIHVKKIINQPNDALESFANTASSMDVEILIPGCMSFSFLFAEKEITEIGEKTIVNPLFASVRIAESLIL